MHETVRRVGKKKFFTSSTHPFVYTKYGTHIVFVTSSPFLKNTRGASQSLNRDILKTMKKESLECIHLPLLLIIVLENFSLKDFLTLINGSNFPSFTFFFFNLFALQKESLCGAKHFSLKWIRLHMGEIYEPLGKILWLLTIFQVGTVFNISQNLWFLV